MTHHINTESPSQDVRKCQKTDGSNFKISRLENKKNEIARNTLIPLHKVIIVQRVSGNEPKVFGNEQEVTGN